jgi:hypothetical protein
LTTYQKLKKSLASFSVVSWLMPSTLVVPDMFDTEERRLRLWRE